MAHEKLHAKDNLDKDHPVDRRTKEVEAESIDYTTLDSLFIAKMP